MPSVNELKELVEECKWTKKTVNGVVGMEVMGENEQSIFLPITGREELLSGSPFVVFETYGYYWSGESSLVSDNRTGWMLFWDSERDFDKAYCPGGLYVNESKLAIRPVRE